MALDALCLPRLTTQIDGRATTRPYVSANEKQGKDTAADLQYLRAIDIQEKQLGPDHPALGTSLGNRAALLAQQVGEAVGRGAHRCWSKSM